MYSTNTITDRRPKFLLLCDCVTCVSFITYQGAKSSENAIEIWKYGSLAHSTAIKRLKAGSYTQPLLSQFKPTVTHEEQRPVVDYDSLGTIGSKTKVILSS